MKPSIVLQAIGVLLFGVVTGACGDSGGGGGEGGGVGGAGGSGAGDLGCGDGFPDPDLGEECDDGNFDDADECLNNCTLAKCGDSVIQAGIETCDDGNADDTDACVTGCVAAACGDGFIQAGVEDCDDGNEEDGDACSSTCVAGGSGCGNGETEPPEECDDGNTIASDDCVDCLTAFCGDGHAFLGVESCDDGNTVDDDSCSNDCFVNVPESFGCPGIAADVAANSDVTLGGDTTDADNDYHADGCFGAGDLAPEYVFAFTAETAGVLTIEMLAINDDLDPVLYVRSDCEGGPELACADSTFAGDAESVTLQATAGTTYYVFADGYDTSSGEFLVSAQLLTSVAGDNCPGVNIPLADLNETYTVSGNTALADPDRTGTGACNAPSTEDIVYKVVPPADGKLVVALDPMYDAALYVRSTSCTQGTQLACSQEPGSGELELVNVPVTAGASYWVFVDGVGGDAGPFSADFTLLPP